MVFSLVSVVGVHTWVPSNLSIPNSVIKQSIYYDLQINVYGVCLWQDFGQQHSCHAGRTGVKHM